MMRVFLEEGRTSDITTELLICAMGNLDISVIVQLLDRVEYKGIIHELIAAAANNPHCGGELVRLLLKGADMTKITDVIFDSAIGNPCNGKEVIQALEETFGPIEVTEDVMLKLIRTASGSTYLPSGAHYLFDPGQVTENIFYSAMSVDPPYSSYKTDPQKPNIRYVVAENALHLPVTLDILKAAGRYCDVHCFRYLWNRGDMAEVASDVLQEAAKNHHGGREIFLFLLEQVENIEIGEEVVLGIVSNRFRSKELFNLLWEWGFELPVTHRVLKTAIATIHFTEGDLWILDRLLERFSHEEVTEDLFKTAAAAGNEQILWQLSELCNMESPAEKWLHVARLYKAVALGDNNTLKDLLQRGVKPEFAQLECSNAMLSAHVFGHVSAVQMLLSAGAAPDALMFGMTPLLFAARFGKLEMVQVLANAGASLDFKGANFYDRFDDGYTPYSIAKKNGHVKVFRFLEQFKQTQDLKREASAANSIQERQPVQLQSDLCEPVVSLEAWEVALVT